MTPAMVRCFLFMDSPFVGSGTTKGRISLNPYNRGRSRMRVYASGLLVAAVTAGSALGQALLCPPSATPPARCDVFHYHVMMYRPDTRGFIELSGINQFASQVACDRARDAAIRHNLAVVDFYRKRNDNRYEPDKFGPCHCDMSATYLNDAARNAQLRLAADTKLRVRERLMDAEVPTDSELMRSADTPAGSPFGAARLVPLPPAPPPTTIANEPADLRMPKSEIGDAPAISDLPLS